MFCQILFKFIAVALIFSAVVDAEVVNEDPVSTEAINEDHIDKSKHNFTDKVNLVCPGESLEGVVWHLNNEKIADKKLFHFDGRSVNFTVGKETMGIYECFELGNETKPVYAKGVYVDPVLEIKNKVTKNAISGETFVFECKAYGFPTPMAHFLNGSKPIVDSPRVTFKSVNESEKTVTINGTIRIQPVEYEDAGKYTCYFETPEKSKVEFEINVKDKFAAMWPFLGICAEVAILCIIIFIYEKRRSKKEAAKEAAAAPGEVDKLNPAKNGDDVRLRK